MSDDSDDSTPPQRKFNMRRSPQLKESDDKEIELLEENNNLRRKLKRLTMRL